MKNESFFAEQLDTNENVFSIAREIAIRSLDIGLQNVFLNA